MKIELHPTPLRHRRTVRESVDQKLGYGYDCTYLQAWNALSNVERVEWMLGELLVGLRDFRLHIWHQNFVDGERANPDWVSIYEALAEVGRPLGEETADLLRWTVARARKGVALASVIPPVWSHSWEPVADWAYSLVERWPEECDPAHLEEVDAYHRQLTAPRKEAPYYPEAKLAVTEMAAADCIFHCPVVNLDALMDSASYALWKVGADDDQLDKFYFGVSRAPGTLAREIAEWVNFDGDGGSEPRFESVRSRLDPLASILGLESSEGQFCALTSEGTFDGLEAALKDYPMVRLREGDEVSLERQLFAALRSDVDIILVRSQDVKDEKVWDTLKQAALTGHLLIFEGESKPCRALMDELSEAGLAVKLL